MRVIAIYNVFDGIELLEGSIRQIYPECFKVLIVYQTTSNFGEVDDGVEEFVQMLALKYKRISLLKYVPDTTISGGQNEKNKRMAGISSARNLGGSHFLLIDCDEYYERGAFRRAKQIIRNGGFDSSACRLFTYFKQPTYRLSPLEDYYVPFISSIDLTLTNEFPVYADPTRLTMGSKFYEFRQEELMMHHFSWVRNDIGKKIRNSSARDDLLARLPDLVENYRNFKLTDSPLLYPECTIVEAPNVFGIHVSR
jgi:hypothetical protein